MPTQNQKDLEEIPKEVLQDISCVFADSVLDALAILFPQKDTQAVVYEAARDEAEPAISPREGSAGDDAVAAPPPG